MPIAGVSIVIAHYGDPRTATALLDDLEKQQGCSTLELLVVDDASPRPMPARPGTRVLRRDANGGFGAAVNTGARAATQPWLLILNSDVRVTPDFVAELVAAAGSRRGVCGPATLHPDGSPDLSARVFPRAGHAALEALAPLRRFGDRPWFQRLIGRRVDCVPGRVVDGVDWVQGSAMLLPLAEFLAAGGFDERFFMYSEEVDLQWRLRHRGHPSAYLGTVSVVHEGGVSTEVGRQAEWLVRSQHTFAAARGHGVALRTAMTVVAVVNLGWNLLRRAAGREADPWGAWRRELYLARLAPWPEPTGRVARAAETGGER